VFEKKSCLVTKKKGINLGNSNEMTYIVGWWITGISGRLMELN
jgi:hypothetical protein